MSEESIETNTTTIVREKYMPEDFIFFEGDIESHFYIVESGTVQIFTKNNLGKRIEILTVEEGEAFGEFALLDGNKPRSASAQATSEVSVIKVSAEGYESLMADLPVWAACMMKSFVVRLKRMTEQLKTSDQFLKR